MTDDPEEVVPPEPEPEPEVPPPLPDPGQVRAIQARLAEETKRYQQRRAKRQFK